MNKQQTADIFGLSIKWICWKSYFPIAFASTAGRQQSLCGGKVVEVPRPVTFWRPQSVARFKFWSNRICTNSSPSATRSYKPEVQDISASNF